LKKSIYILFLFLCAACQSDVDYLDSDVFVGSYRVYDQRIAFPFSLVFTEDEILLYNQDGMEIDQGPLLSPIKNMDTVSMSNHEYFFSYVNPERLFAFDLMDSLRFKKFENRGLSAKDAAVFYKTQLSKNNDKSAVKNILKSQSWHFPNFETNPNDDLVIDQEWRFLEQEVLVYTYYHYENQMLHIELKKLAYQIIDINGVTLLSVRNKDKVRNPLPLIQLMDVDKNKLVIKYFGVRNPTTQIIKPFTLPYKKASRNDAFAFSNCFDGYQGEYYYGDDVTYFQGNQYIVDQISADAPPADGNGYLILHFNINCKKELGRFGLLQMNQSFKARKFNADFVAHVFKEVRKIKEWPSTLSTEDFLPYKDVHAFLMFKIEDGKITDLCP